MISAYSPLPSDRGTKVTAAATEGTTKGCRSMSGLRKTPGIPRGRISASSVNTVAMAISATKYQTKAPPRTEIPDHAVDTTNVRDR